MRAWPIVVGSALIAFGLFAWLGGALAGSAGFGTPNQGSVIDSLVGVPGALFAAGVVILVWGLTEARPR